MTDRNCATCRHRLRYMEGFAYCRNEFSTLFNFTIITPAMVLVCENWDGCDD